MKDARRHPRDLGRKGWAGRRNTAAPRGVTRDLGVPAALLPPDASLQFSVSKDAFDSEGELYRNPVVGPLLPKNEAVR